MSARHTILAAVALAALAAVAALGAFPQPQHYHAFADARAAFGVPNFWNVASNLPFALVGLVGLREVARKPTGMLAELAPAYSAFFAGCVLIAVGSSLYHLAPVDATLVWDRVPMTISFMAFVAIVAGEHFDPVAARRALPALVATGVATVAWWRVTDDLRPYLAVQFAPMLLVPLTMLLFRSRLAPARYLVAMLTLYAVAKALESYDHEVFEALGGVVSGHTLKHLAAAGGMYALVLALRNRRQSTASVMTNCSAR
jgi:hypothetical protein